ncbi:MAG: hypothetical protein LC746_14435 [Acidobacteria bacterium]|nr:hypothetical protein [Acidobacteriota bacterium]
MNKQQNTPTNDQPAAKDERGDFAPPQPPRQKEQFVEPVVSVPVDVLESTAFFQAPTVDTAVA